jgi:hypothetical protein
MTEKRKKILLFGGIILIGLCGTGYKIYLDTFERVYTVGTIEKIWKPVKGNKEVAYNYTIDGQTFEGSISNSGHEDIALPKKRFLVEIPVGHLGRGVMIFDIHVPDTITPPHGGWRKKPKKW